MPGCWRNDSAYRQMVKDVVGLQQSSMVKWPGVHFDAEEIFPRIDVLSCMYCGLCEEACPTDAIVFGNVNDPNSQVARLKRSNLNYGLLAELNTRPRTTYLAAIRNPNPELEPARPAGQTEHH